jgi:5-formyltetrahydrofolate cyclo-ligase
MKTKEEIRVEMLTKRIKQLPMLKKEKDKRMIDTINSFPRFQIADEILFYMPIHGEVDITTLFIEHKDTKKFVLPRVVNKSKDLTLYQIETLDDLVKGTFRIPEPKKALEKITPEKLDFIILPGIAFDLEGHRIGYGQGYFDRLLKKTNCPIIGVAYDFQIVENIGGEPHDVPVDMIVTESRTIRIKKTS